MEPSIVGTWGFRSLLNDRDMLTPFGNLELDTGTLKLELLLPGELSGSLRLADRWLPLVGRAKLGRGLEVHLESRLEDGSANTLLYGWMTTPFDVGDRRVDTLVGSISMNLTRKGGATSKALVASWYAVRDPVSHLSNEFSGFGGAECGT